MKRMALSGMLAALTLSASAAGATITGSQADAILSELREIKQLLARQGGVPAPARPSAPAAPEIVTVPLGDGPGIGSPDAPVVLMEFTDFQCPFCKRFGIEILPELQTKFISTGKLRLVARELPLDMHKQAVPAARAEALRLLLTAAVIGFLFNQSSPLGIRFNQPDTPNAGTATDTAAGPLSAVAALAEVARLRAELDHMTRQRDIIKKAMAIMGQEQKTTSR